VDPIGPDNAAPKLGTEHPLNESEEGSGTHQDSAGSLLSIKVRRRMTPRPRHDSGAPSRTNADLEFPTGHNGHEAAKPEVAITAKAQEPTSNSLGGNADGHDAIFKSGVRKPAEPPRRRRPDEIVTYWSHLRAGRRFPALADIDLGRIAADWPNSLIIRHRVGSRVLEAERIGGTRSSLSSARNDGQNETQIDVSPLMLQWLLSLAGEVTKTKRPMGDTESFPSLRRSVSYRAFALPLSDDQKEIDHILCHVCLDD